MIVHYGYLVRPLSGPPEGNTPLVIDSNGAKARQIASKRLQSVAGRNGEVAEGASLIQPASSVSTPSSRANATMWVATVIDVPAQPSANTTP